MKIKAKQAVLETNKCLFNNFTGIILIHNNSKYYITSNLTLD